MGGRVHGQLPRISRVVRANPEPLTPTPTLAPTPTPSPTPTPTPTHNPNPTPNPNPNQVRGEVPSSGRVHGEAVRVHRL